MGKDRLEKNKLNVSRRSFLKWTSALSGTVALGGIQNVATGNGFSLVKEVAASPTKGEWIPVACWGDCGSKGFNKVYVVDGIIKQGGTDDTIPDTPETPQLRACAKGRAQRQRILGPDRLKYPMIRKNWAPGGGKKELRGRDEWVRISWDEALNILASEIKRIIEKHGNTSIYMPSPATASVYTEVARALNLCGGFISDWGSCSSGTWTDTGRSIGLPKSRLGTGEDINDFADLQNSDLIVMWSFNPAWGKSGVPMVKLTQCKEKGIEFVCVDPFFTPSSAALGVKPDAWYPCRPGTDHALVLGMMHTLLTEDDPKKNPLVRWDYLNKYTVGFDKDHMPQGADPKENLKDYILGVYDKTPKSAKWAAAICGVHPEKIKFLARKIAKTKNVAIIMSSSAARINNADSYPQAIMTLGFMTGHIGTSGNCVGSDGGHTWLTEGKQLVKGGTWIGRPTNFPDVEPVPNPINHIRINRMGIWDAVLTGKYRVNKDKEQDIDIRMLYLAKVERIGQTSGTVKAIEAFRKVDFVVCQDLYLTSTCKFSDLVLPVTSFWERAGNMAPGYRNHLLWTRKAMEPIFEAKDDVWIAKELADRLGVDSKRVQPYSPEQDMFNQVARAEVIDEKTGEYVPLVTITDEDIKKAGVNGKPQKGKISYSEFRSKGIYHVKRKKNDGYNHIVMQDFIKDPTKNPLPSESGKFEIHCRKLADLVNNIGFSKIRPIPTYNRAIEGYEDCFENWEKKIEGKYPLQLLSLHVNRRAHSNFENTPWLREAFDHQAMINPVDAAKRGLKDNDTVLISSRHGKMLRRVMITETIRPGVIGMGQGGWLQWDDELGLDRGGCINVLVGAHTTGQGHFGFNSCNVQIEKWGGEPLPMEKDVPLDIPTFSTKGGNK